MNYNNKTFKPVTNSSNGEVDSEMTFTYFQQGKLLECNYSGENILKGQLLGIVDGNGIIYLTYQQVNKQGELRTGTCISTPHINENGILELHEKWQWTNGDQSKGESILIEVQ